MIATIFRGLLGLPVTNSLFEDRGNVVASTQTLECMKEHVLWQVKLWFWATIDCPNHLWSPLCYVSLRERHEVNFVKRTFQDRIDQRALPSRLDLPGLPTS